MRRTARFADPRPFCPVTGRPDCSPDWCAAHPGRPVLRRSARAGRRAGLVQYPRPGRAADRPAPSHRGCAEVVTGACRPPPGWKTGTAPWRATLRPDLGAAASGGVTPQGFPVSLGQGLDPAEPVMYLSWTGDVPVVYPPYTCAGDMPGSPRPRSPLVLLRARCQADWRRSGVKNRGTFHLQRPCYWPILDRGAGKKSVGCRREPRQLDRCARGLRVRCAGILFPYSTSMFTLVCWQDTRNSPRLSTVCGRPISRRTGTSEQTWSKRGIRKV